jgi:hypothetical protein
VIAFVSQAASIHKAPLGVKGYFEGEQWMVHFLPVGINACTTKPTSMNRSESLRVESISTRGQVAAG